MGVIVDEKRQEVVRIQTVTDDKEPGINQGLGSFTFTPKLGKRYSLRVDSPIGIDRPMPLPAAKNGGVTLNIPQGVVDSDINVMLHNVGQPRELLVGAYCRGRMLHVVKCKAEANKAVQVTLKPEAQVGGVLRITVFEKVGAAEQPVYRPLAERLIYRKNARKVDVAIASDRPTYQPGEAVQLRLQAFNEKRDFVPAVAMVAVVDTSVLKLRDEKTARALPTHFLLTTEVRNPEELEHADFLLGNHPQAARSLDLLLGSQGWRRFAEQDPKRFQQAQQKGRAPIFLANANSVPQFLDAERKQIDKLDEEYIPKAVGLQKKLAAAEQLAEGAPVQVQAVDKKDAELQQAQFQIDEANHRLREIRMFLVQFGLGGALLTLLFIGFYLISVGLRRLSEGGNPRGWLVSGLTLLGLLFLVSVIGTFALMGEPIGDDFRFRNERAQMAAPFAVKQAPPMFNQADAPVVWPEKELLDENEAVLLPDALNPVAINFGNKKQPPVQFFQEQQQFVNNANNLEVPAVIPMPVWDAGLDERQLRQQGNYQAIVQNHLGRRVQLPPVHELCVVREYAHRHKEQPDGVRARLQRDSLLAAGAGDGGRQGASAVRPVRCGHALPGPGVEPHPRRPARLEFRRDRRQAPIQRRTEDADRGDADRSDRHPGRRHQRTGEKDVGATVGPRQGAQSAGWRRTQSRARAKPDEARHAARQAEHRRRHGQRAHHRQDRRA